MRRTALTLSSLGALACAATAAAASGTITASLTPNKVSARSALNVSASGPFGASGLPTSVRIQVQKGFTSSAKSVKQLCTNKNACPDASKIGSGQLQATGSAFGLSIPVTAPFTLFLGKPVQNGDIGSVVFSISATVLGQTQSGSAVGRLFVPSGGGLEILFANLPKFTPPSGATVTVNSLNLNVKAMRTVTKKVGKGKHKHKATSHYSVITNPPNCGGHWTGAIDVTFTSGSILQSLSAACTG